ncbi:hypothetical protein [Luteibacter anthropi]|uniref:Uncharacterized protein n=1 Tax=Luteibacter anthropi TaxID=564369 RepID=A0A7X5UCT4_9GAMM|nr:hypothetical protein [Luteibacter anthropi]NII08095.1 hypothetical protein [Luteibacter anthropi]
MVAVLATGPGGGGDAFAGSIPIAIMAAHVMTARCFMIVLPDVRSTLKAAGMPRITSMSGKAYPGRLPEVTREPFPDIALIGPGGWFHRGPLDWLDAREFRIGLRAIHAADEGAHAGHSVGACPEMSGQFAGTRQTIS